MRMEWLSPKKPDRQVTLRERCIGDAETSSFCDILDIDAINFAFFQFFMRRYRFYTPIKTLRPMSYELAASACSTIKENRFVCALQHYVPFQPTVARFFRDERMAAPRLN